MPEYAFVSTFVGVVGLLVAVATLALNRKRDGDEHAKREGTMGTKLDFIGSDIKDIKADQRVIQRDINDVRDIAIRARDRAEAAHNRLDRLEKKEEA